MMAAVVLTVTMVVAAVTLQVMMVLLDSILPFLSVRTPSCTQPQCVQSFLTQCDFLSHLSFTLTPAGLP